MPNDCIALPPAYNPHNHRPNDGSVQRGLSAAIVAAAGFDVCAATDKRYSLDVMSKKRLPESSEDAKEWAAVFFQTIKGESDRGCVLVAAAFLDEALELLLRSKMKSEPKIVKQSVDPLLMGIGPLKSFWARTELCRVLNLLAEWEYDDLTQIRNLRNLFAHSYEQADFDDLRVVEMVMKLNAFGSRTLPQGQAPKRTDVKDARQRFSLAASWLAGALHKRAGMPKA